MLHIYFSDDDLIFTLLVTYRKFLFEYFIVLILLSTYNDKFIINLPIKGIFFNFFTLYGCKPLKFSLPIVTVMYSDGC